jgi:hypothetical protein
VSACVDGVAELRRVVIEELKKYPESMEWENVPLHEFTQAIFRHVKECIDSGNPFAVDPETKLPHIYAIQFNCMVLAMRLKVEDL